MAQQQAGRKNDDDLKTSWPELAHARAEYAVDVIHKDRPDVDDIPALPVGTKVPPGYHPTRVILFVYNRNDLGLWVDGTPVIG
jgi:hypothetical protein